jgi:hypothetical protein
MALDKSELVGPFRGNPSLPIPAEGARSYACVLEVHGESLQEMGGGWESKLPGDRGDCLSGVSGGYGVGVEKDRGGGERLEAAERGGGVDASNGIGSSMSDTASGSGEEASKSCGHGEKVQEKAERNISGVGSSDIGINKVVEQNQAQ